MRIREFVDFVTLCVCTSLTMAIIAMAVYIQYQRCDRERGKCERSRKYFQPKLNRVHTYI